MTVGSFEDLEVFKRAYKLSLEVHAISVQMPAREQYGLAEQIRRASKSICVNIAEGYAKQGYSTAEFKRYLQIAIGSADEMRVWSRYWSRPRPYRGSEMEDVARRMPGDRQDAARAVQKLGMAKKLFPDFCLLTSDS